MCVCISGSAVTVVMVTGCSPVTMTVRCRVVAMALRRCVTCFQNAAELQRNETSIIKRVRRGEEESTDKKRKVRRKLLLLTYLLVPFETSCTFDFIYNETDAFTSLWSTAVFPQTAFI